MKTKIEEEIKNIWKIRAKDVDKQITGDRDRWMTDLTEVEELVEVMLGKVKEKFNKIFGDNYSPQESHPAKESQSLDKQRLSSEDIQNQNMLKKGRGKMKIYKISQDVNKDYDTYDSAVVIANDEEEARRISPSEFYEIGKDDHWHFVYPDGKRNDEGLRPDYFGWCAIKDVKVEYIGEAKKGSKKGVVCASFNAG